MSRAVHDQFIDDDEEETCPLCVEEFDLTDQGFRPCPCGYQICQFCYHNVKTNMNGLCPACRRPYSDENIEYKLITPEETAAHKARQAQKQKKTQAALQKEKQKAEADNLSRKHLAGMRVVQKNLVYVTGLSPNSQEDQLLQTLRGDQYFGQYGKIIKIVVSKAKDMIHPHSVGVYVTYERKEDAASCIAAVDGSKNGERTLRAQHGTTKYCSAYLRGETCTNRNCMFLHEPGEANESYSRADLSALNAGQHGSGRPPPPQSQQPVAAQPMIRQGSGDQPQSPTLERPALPSTASWASKPSQPGRTESLSTGTPQDSPAPVRSTPAPVPVPEEEPEPEPAPVQEYVPPPKPQLISPLTSLLKNFKLQDFTFVWSSDALSQSDRDAINDYPPLFDRKGPARLRMKREREEEQRRMELEAQAFQQPPAIETEDNPEMSGSLQLGGEPEERPIGSQVHSAIHPPGQDSGLDQRFSFGGRSSSPALGSERGYTPQQQMLLQTLKPNTPGAYSSNQTSSFQQQSTQPTGHARGQSRYSFANDTATASAAVKPVANQKLMNQQSAMMPQAGGNHFGGQHQQPYGQFHTSNVHGPPPGLKTTGTPPVTGNLTFAQGHGFATGGLQYGAGASRTSQQEGYNIRELARATRDAPASGMDSKHNADFPSLTPTSGQQAFAIRAMHDESRTSTPPVPPGFEGHESRRGTPTVPPGLTRPSALPDLGDNSSRPGSRPSSRASIKRTAPQILPVLPLRPSTPGTRRATPSRQGSKDDYDRAAHDETPTKPSRTTTSSDLKMAMSAQDAAISGDTGAGADAANDDREDETASVVKASADAGKQDAEASTKQVAQSVAAVIETPVSSPTKVAKSTPAAKGKGAAQASNAENAPPKGMSETPKRKHPGKIEIPAPVSKKEQAVSVTATPVDVGTPGRPGRAPSQAATSKITESPMPSPAIKAPRTIRLTNTPKTEAPPSNAAPVVTLPNAAAHRFPSRQPSVSSINHPGTPSSDHVSMSDNISITSTSQSRANSPPPASRVGSAPVRDKTKSQQKKDRQIRAKQLEEAEIAKVKAAEASKVLAQETEQEAVVSRMKKTRKEKAAKPPKPTKSVNATTDNTPVVSRPSSPGPKLTTPEVAAKVEVPSPVIKEVSKPPTPTRVTPVPQAPVQTLQSPHEPSPPPTPTFTPAQMIAEIKNAAPEFKQSLEALFKVSNSHSFKTPLNVSPKELANAVGSWRHDFKVNLSKEDVEALLQGRTPAYHYGGEDNRTFDRGMVTPSGAHLRALTKELETRFLELERALREVPDEMRFHPTKPQNDTKLPTIDLEALRQQYENSGRGPSVMEQMVQDGSTMKKGAFLVDEASKYINEYVMPPATPPPSAGARTQQQGGGFSQHGSQMEKNVHGLDVTERLWSEAKRTSEEREAALRKAVKKNKKVAGMV